MTTDIWHSTPEAEAFCNDIVKNVEQYKLFPDESFVDFRLGIFATAGVDAHGEQFDLESLNATADRINSHRVWAAAMHDPTIQPTGRAIAAKVFWSSKARQHILAGVMGIYGTDRLPTFADVGVTSAALTSPEVGNHLHPAELSPALGFDPNDFDESLIAAALKELPPSLTVRSERHVRKAFEGLTIISVAVGLTALAKIPFLEELQREAAKAFFGWLRTSLFPRICGPQRVLFELTSEHNGCRVQFVSRATTPAILAEATERSAEAAQSALTLLDRFSECGFDILVYEYDSISKKWLPLHAATTKYGVISNRPQLIAMDQMKGFSLGGVSGEVTLAGPKPRSKQSATTAPALPLKTPPQDDSARTAEKERLDARRAYKKARNKMHKRRKGR